MRADSGENVARVEDLVLRMGVVLAIHCCWVIHSRRGTSLQSQPYPEFSQRQHLTLVGGGGVIDLDLRLTQTCFPLLFSKTPRHFARSLDACWTPKLRLS